MDDDASGSERSILRTLDKGFSVYEVIASAGRRGISAGNLEQQLGYHRVTLGRFLRTFVTRGYVEEVPGADRFRLSLKTLSLNFASLDGLPCREVGAPLLDELWQRTRETVHLVMMDNGDVITIDRLESEQPLTLRTQVGARRHAYCTAAGKAILAHLPESEVDRILSRGMPPIAVNTITDPTVYKQQLQGVRIEGYALDDEELADGIRCTASPFFDYSGRVIGAVSLSAPCVRVSVEKLRIMAGAVRDTALQLSRQLGYRSWGATEANTNR
ncbi:IclR family transcriptional regulator [Roseixanthobacter liquoris]|uniref:IclR family transcriptional regulator n=1 Tax=Roseixanthobacter liquoris TaxID=3119921 RepID=UPI00372966CC